MNSLLQDIAQKIKSNKDRGDEHMMAPFVAVRRNRTPATSSAMSLNSALRNTQYSHLNRAERSIQARFFFASFFFGQKERRDKRAFDSGLRYSRSQSLIFALMNSLSAFARFFAPFFSTQKETRRNGADRKTNKSILPSLSTFAPALFLALFLSLTATAQDFSYIYIQGDKETPFYVRMDGEMLPRYGKNYSIISQLAPGPIELEFLFQQNAYPAQKFALNVPADKPRGFLLLRKGDAFSLYDLEKNYYLHAGNTIEEDKEPEKNIATVPHPEEIIPPVTAPQPVTPKEQPKAKPVAKKTAPKKTPSKKQDGNQPRFLDNVQLPNEHNTPGASSSDTASIAHAKNIPNSDCPNAASNDEFDEIEKTAANKSDKNRLKYLLGILDDHCFTSNQVRILTRTITAGDAERYTFLKRAYARTTDQAVFHRLEDLLSSDEWKGYFRTLIN